MPVLIDKYVDDDVRLGIWEIKEDYDQLIDISKPDKDDLKTVQGFCNYKRKLEWLSVRALINYLANKQTKIVYNEDRKPFVDDKEYNISISHSNNFTSILMSKNKKVGIDLEYMNHKISRIADKFINEKEEVISEVNDRKKLHLYIHWCAKESLYKICDKQDINFKKNLTITPFEIKQEGKIKGTVNNRFGIEDFDLQYFTIDNYSIVWCSK